MNANERFEYMAELFYKQTGVIAPGKDAPAGFNTDSDEKRREVWSEWAERFYSDLFASLV
jgi:hypothetical protein